MIGVLRAPSRVTFGCGALGQVPDLVLEHGRRALICTDHVIAATGAFVRFVGLLELSGVQTEVFDRGEPDLPLEVVENASTIGSLFAPDVIIGYGGGSSIDLAKVVAILVAYDGPLSNYYGENRVPGPITPVVAIPTTSGTGSEASPVAVVSDHNLATKVGISSPRLVPAHAVVDPLLTITCPPSVTAHSGVDALSHAVEAFTARGDRFSGNSRHLPVFVGKSVLTDGLAIESVRLSFANLERAVSAPDDIEARSSMAMGSLLAGLAFGSAGTTAAHAFQYPVGALTGTPHGLGVGVLLPYVLARIANVRVHALSQLSEAIGVRSETDTDTEAAHGLILAVHELTMAVGLPGSLSDVGLTREQLPAVAAAGLKVERLMDNYAESLDLHDATRMLEAAHRGDLAAYLSSQGRTPST